MTMLREAPATVTSPILALPLLTTGPDHSLSSVVVCTVRCSAEISSLYPTRCNQQLSPFCCRSQKYFQTLLNVLQAKSLPQIRLTTTCLDYTNHHMDIFKTQFFFIKQQATFIICLYMLCHVIGKYFTWVMSFNFSHRHIINV